MGRLLLASLLCSILLTPSIAVCQERKQGPPSSAEDTSTGKKQIRQISLEELTDMISHKYRDRVILLSFWSPYCGECLELLPLFSELYSTYRDRGFTAIGISLVGYPQKVWLSVNRMRVNFPVFMGNADVFDAYQIHNLPCIILIGRDGKEEIAAHGHEANRTAFNREIKRMLEGHPKGRDWFKWLLR